MSVRRALAVVVLVLCFGTGACADPSSSATGDGVLPDTWAGRVCGALNPWRSAIADLTTKAQQQMAKTTTPSQTKVNLVALLSGAEGASETARRTVADIGAPAVPDGPKIASRFVDSLTKARDAYANARAKVDALPTDSPKSFYDGVAAAFATLGAEYQASAIDTANVGSTELQRAFDEVPECG